MKRLEKELKQTRHPSRVRSDYGLVTAAVESLIIKTREKKETLENL
jgi:hypothetical protein